MEPGKWERPGKLWRSPSIPRRPSRDESRCSAIHKQRRCPSICMRAILGLFQNRLQPIRKIAHDPIHARRRYRPHHFRIIRGPRRHLQI
jgi:hypothetical protein